MFWSQFYRSGNWGLEELKDLLNYTAGATRIIWTLVSGLYIGFSPFTTYRMALKLDETTH